VFQQALAQGHGLAQAQNITLLLLVLFENVHALNCRSERASLLSQPLRENSFLLVAIIAAQGLHIAAMHMPGLREVLGVAPVSLTTWAEVAVIALTLLGFMELWKTVRRRIEAKSAAP
jgi:magnesium-transporting ATPase (P-type)